MNSIHSFQLHLLQRALFGKRSSETVTVQDWEALFQETRLQTVHLLTYDVLTAKERELMPAEILKQWEMAAFVSLRSNEQLAHEQKHLRRIFLKENIAWTILKGSSCAENYPKPELRCAGDIDLLVTREQMKYAQQLLEQRGYKTDSGKCQWHVALQKSGLVVELHMEPAGIPDGVIGEEIRKYVQAGNQLDVCQQAVVLLLHKLNHLRKDGLGLRHVCDWAMFVNTQLSSNVWEQLEPVLRRFGLLQFCKIITCLCVEYLGLPGKAAPWCLDADQTVTLALMEDILQAGNFGCKANRYSQKLFTDGGPGGRLKSLYRSSIRICKTHWPACRKNSILLPFAPVVLLVQWIKQKNHPSLYLLESFCKAKPRQKLYQELKPFQPELF